MIYKDRILRLEHHGPPVDPDVVDFSVVREWVTQNATNKVHDIAGRLLNIHYERPPWWRRFLNWVRRLFGLKPRYNPVHAEVEIMDSPAGKRVKKALLKDWGGVSMGVEGIIRKRRGNVITDFQVRSVSIFPPEDD